MRDHKKNRIGNEDGSVLAEGIVAMVIIAVISLCVVQSLILSNNLMDKSNDFQKRMYDAKFQLEWGKSADQASETKITFSIDGQELAGVKVMEYIYEEGEPYLVILRPDESEYGAEKDSLR